MDAVTLEAKGGAAAPSAVHLLPCEVSASGPAPVSAYFMPFEGEDGTRMVQFRGRLLEGQDVALPPPLQGLVFREHADAVDFDKRSWVPDGAFSSYTAWRHDKKPTEVDGHQQVAVWHRIAAALHGTQ